MRDLFKDTLLRIEGEKSPAPGRNRTHILFVMRHVLYHCAATTANLSKLDLGAIAKQNLAAESQSKNRRPG